MTPQWFVEGTAGRAARGGGSQPVTGDLAEP